MSVLDLLDDEKARETFLVTREWGFLQTDVATELPEPCDVWLDLAKNVDDLLPQGRVRSEVDRLEEISTETIESSVKLMRLAYTCLCKITMLYVWQDFPGEPSKRLPRQLAVPLCKVANVLGLPPIYTYPAIITFNVVRPDPSAPMSLDNMHMVLCPTGGQSARAFFGIGALLEAENSRNIAAILDIAQAVNDKDYAQVASRLRQIESATRQFKEISKLYHGSMEPKLFFTQVTPYLTGWAPPTPLPEGLIYEVVSSEPIQCITTSAGQSSIFQTLDYLLGIEHKEQDKAFFAQKRQYMLPKHGAFIAAVGNLGLRKFVEQSDDPEVKLAYQACLDALVAFRSYHIQLVTKFVLIPAKKQKQELSDSGDQDSGLGGLIPMLKGMRNSTVETSSKPV